MENNVILQQPSLFLKKKNDSTEGIEVIEKLKIKYSIDCYDINTVLIKHLKNMLEGP